MPKAFLILILTLFVPGTNAKDATAPELTLANAAGEAVTLPRTHEGADIYLFWASWCPYCKALMLQLEDTLVEYDTGVTVYALNIRDDEDPVKFMDERGYDFILIPEADSIMELYGVQPIPAVFVVDGKGRIRFNLYEMVFNDDNAYQALSHSEKAGLRAPRWAAAIRQAVDGILKEGSTATEAAAR